MKKLVVILWVVLLVCGISGVANATLINLGGGMIYDDYLDVTWLQDANYALTSGTDPYGAMDGKMDFTNADLWADSLDYGGYEDWRLPIQTELQNLGGWYHNINSFAPGDFINLQAAWYWTTTSPEPGKRRLYHFEGGGVQTAWEAYDSGYVLALRDIPEPSTLLLLGSGLVGLAFARRRMKKG